MSHYNISHYNASGSTCPFSHISDDLHSSKRVAGVYQDPAVGAGATQAAPGRSGGDTIRPDPLLERKFSFSLGLNVIGISEGDVTALLALRPFSVHL